jgi:hypothetical protein
MLEYEPHIDTKITAMLDQWANRTAQDPVIDVYGWAHWLGFDIVCESDRMQWPNLLARLATLLVLTYW